LNSHLPQSPTKLAKERFTNQRQTLSTQRV
jgi:two-component system, OmpR family, response regulator